MKRHKIVVGDGPEHILVHLCRDKAEFDRITSATILDTKDAWGLCMGAKTADYRKGGAGKECDAALVYLINDQVGPGYVAHELTHAALWLLRGHIKKMVLNREWWRNGPAGEIEEHVCNIVGEVTTDFWQWWYSKGGLK